MITVTPDVLNPMSEDLERAFGLEEYDRMIANPVADQEEAYRFLLSLYPKTKKDPDKYLMKQQAMNPGMNPQMNPMQNNQPNNPMAQRKGMPQQSQPPMPVGANANG